VAALSGILSAAAGGPAVEADGVQPVVPANAKQAAARRAAVKAKRFPSIDNLLRSGSERSSYSREKIYSIFG
jgi:hypothetical protein